MTEPHYGFEDISNMSKKELMELLVHEGKPKTGKINILKERLSEHYMNKYMNDKEELPSPCEKVLKPDDDDTPQPEENDCDMFCAEEKKEEKIDVPVV